jgi:hypothetical protein
VHLTLRRNIGCKIEDMTLRNLLSQPRISQRTPEWIRPKTKESGDKSESGLEHILKPLSDLYVNLERKRDGATGRQILNENISTSKAKTRGASTSVQPANGAGPSPSALPDEQPVFNVDSRALRVFRAVFYTPSVSGTPGEVAWTDFLHAMHVTGFVPEKL